MAVVALCMLAGDGVAAAAKRPDLAVSKLSANPMTVVTGGTVRVKDTVRNQGKRRAKKTHVAYFLSEDARKGKGDRVVSGRRTVKKLVARKRDRGSRSVTVPAGVPAGAYRLIACADARAKVKESNERNNCRAAKGTFAILAVGSDAPAPVLPAAPAPAPSSPVTPAPSGISFPQQPDPLKVSDEVESSGRTQAMYPFGSAMSVTGDDGIKYTLTMPKDALLSATDVTMTPVAKVNDVPFAKDIVGAVRLEPHGLQLQQPATLTIEPPAGTPVAERTAFLYHQDGHDFHLYPLGSEPTLTLRLMHFSTPGVGLATPAERAAVVAHPPARAGAQLEQAAAQVPDPGTVFPPFYDSVVRPKLQAAETNDALARDAIAEGLNWARSAELMGLENDPEYLRRRDEMYDRIERVLRNAVEKAYERCVRDHDLEQIVRLASLARIAALMGFDLGDVQDKLLRCTNFELRFDSRITSTDAWTGDEAGRSYQLDATWRVRSTVPIDITAVGSAPITWAAFSYESIDNYNCGESGIYTMRKRDTSPTTEGALMAMLALDLNPRELAPAGQPAPTPPDDYLRLFFQTAPKETYLNWSEGCTTVAEHTSQESHWKGHFDSFHIDNFPFKVALDRGAQTGDLIHAETWDRSRGGRDSSGAGRSRDTEFTTLDLWHKPLP